MWFTPTFTKAPSPPPKPVPVYHTEVPRSVKRARRRVHVDHARPVAHVRHQRTVPPIKPHRVIRHLRVPPALMKEVYLSKHKQDTVQSALHMIATQIHYHFIDHATGHTPVPPHAVTWMSGNPDGAPAMRDLIRLGQATGKALDIDINARTRTITLKKG